MEPILSSLLSDHAVLQAGRALRITGRGVGDVTLSFAGQTVYARADGTFSLILPPLAAGGPFTLTVTVGEQTQCLSDLWVGEVLLLAGQSNAELPMAEAEGAAEDGYDYEDAPGVRMYFASRNFGHHAFRLGGQDYDGTYTYPLRADGQTLDDRWVPLTKENAPAWPALAYHLGRRIARERGVAVGIVCVVRGASVIQSFLPLEEQADFSLGWQVIHPDHYSTDRYFVWNEPGRIYHDMWEKILPAAFSRAVWYQGESNASSAEGAIYDKMLTRLIERWRTDLNDPALPVAVVQIHDCARRLNDGWRAVQAAQAHVTETVPGTVLVRSADICDPSVIHPKNKLPLAERLYDALYGDGTVKNQNTNEGI